MFFSVIVPVYKVEKYLRKCIDSIIGQTFSDFEVILVDDGSPDMCPAICDEYAEKDGRIKVVHKENGGLASARQAGIKECSGEYVLNLDSDDAIETDTLEIAYDIIKKYDCDIVSFAYKWVKGDTVCSVTDDGLDEGIYTREEIEKTIYPRLLMDENMQHISYYLSGKVVRRALLLPNQLSVDPKISLGEDLCCVTLCYMQAKSVYISKKCTYLYTVRDDSISKDFNTSQIDLVGYVISFLQGIDKNKPLDFNDQICRYSFFMCFAILASGAEGNHFKCIKDLKSRILNSAHIDHISTASFNSITLKSRVSLFLMKKRHIRTVFYFLNLCKRIKRFIKRG